MQQLKNFLNAVLSIIVPQDAHVGAIEAMSEEEILGTVPQAEDTSAKNCTALFTYRYPIVKTAIWEIKYRGNRTLVRKFAALLYTFLLDELGDATLFANFADPLLVPIPVHRQTLRERGHNQCELIAREITRLDGEKNLTLSLSALSKIKATPHQSRLGGRAKRLANLAGSFSADARIVRGRNIIVLDDVITTGATMNEAMKTLRAAGAKHVLGIAIAH